jgi:alpha-beta hydrolase superfamily lysophospholipase
MAMTETMIEGVDGARILLRSWDAVGAPRACLVLQHGFNAHSGHMDWAAQQFAAAGYACYAVDLRGRGRSSGERFFVENFDHYLADLDLAVTRAKADHPELPLFLLGHSAGGVTATSYAARYPERLSGLICHSFAFRVPAPRLVLDIVQWLGGVLPRLKALKLNNAHFSRDPEWVAMMNADPLIHDERQPARTVGEMWKADKRLEQAFATMMLPVLIIHGTEDKATLPAGSEYFHDHAGSPDKTLKLYPGHYHDLLADIGKEAVLADILAWTNARVAVPHP